MDQQNNSTEKHVPTEAEIARLEAEAAAALQRGEAVPRSDAPAPAPKPASNAVEEADDDDDEEYIPSEMEKRINAMSPEQWKRWQMLGGAAVGIAIVVCLAVFGQELSTYGLIVAALLAIVLPRYLERSWRCKLNTARMAMIVAIVIGLAILFVVTGLRHGFNLRAQ